MYNIGKFRFKCLRNLINVEPKGVTDMKGLLITVVLGVAAYVGFKNTKTK